MKKIFLPFLFLLILGTTYAQPDTVVVPNIIDGELFGAINTFINGDTTSTGERVNPERYYKLQKGKIYFLDGILFTNFNFFLIADEVEDGETPPIVASTTGADGAIQIIQFKFFKNAYVKNIIFQMTPPEGNGESNACFFLSGNGANYEFDNVMIEWGLWTGIVTEKPVNKIVVKNCYFKNPQHKTNIWNGRGLGFYQENPADTVIMQNNTFFNMNSFAFFADISSIPPDYLLFDHNTIVNSMKFPIHSFWLPSATVTNNLFYNAHAYGETSADKVGQDPDLLRYGIINISEIPSDLLEYYDISENERQYTVTNNGFFYESDVHDYLSSYGLEQTPFMNSRVVGMFGDTNYPNLSNEEPIVENPNFINAGEGMSNMIQWMKNKRDLMGNTYWGWDSDGEKFEVEWPLIEDLSYTNETMKVASEGGFPLGDLNWWGSKKAEWEEWSNPTDAIKNTPSAVSNASVAPNPAQDQLIIDYSLEANSIISISVHNINGSRVAQIFSGKQVSGDHSTIWNIDNEMTNGIYLIRISDEIGSITQKVVIQK